MNQGFTKHIDWSILAPALILVVFGLTALLSINIEIFKSQLFFLGLSLVAFFIASHADYRVLPRYGLPIYVISLILLFTVLFLGIQSHGAIRWIELFGTRLQFSELLKPFLLVCLSCFIVKRQLSFRTLFTTVILFLPILILIFKQPDLGNAIIYFWAATLTLFVPGFSLVWFGILFAVLLGIFPFLWHVLHEYQRQRIMTFLYPAQDPLGTSYNAIQSLIAVGSGEFFGKGLALGTQSHLRFLPERHTDFIFSSLCEELGFVGAIIIVACFAYLLWRVYSISIVSKDKFQKLFVISAFFLLLVQFFINIGMNIGIIPIVGVTLPFVSYGGSSLLSSFILLGLVNACKSTLGEKSALEIG